MLLLNNAQIFVIKTVTLTLQKNLVIIYLQSYDGYRYYTIKLFTTVFYVKSYLNDTCFYI